MFLIVGLCGFSLLITQEAPRRPPGFCEVKGVELLPPLGPPQAEASLSLTRRPGICGTNSFLLRHTASQRDRLNADFCSKYLGLG